MHSSRMHTACLLAISPSMHCVGGDLLLGGVLLLGGAAPEEGCVLRGFAPGGVSVLGGSAPGGTKL